MTKGRLEAFSDGVIAIIITIMVLELRPPHEATIVALRDLLPTFLSYVLSFVFVGIYWNNHHHMMHAVQRVSGGALWANLHLLFWLSLVPFFTAWMGDTHAASLPVASYGVVLFMSGVAYTILQTVLIREQGPHSRLAAAVDGSHKGKLSLVLYAVAVPVAFVRPWLAEACYVAVALMWFVPDRRIERTLNAER